MNGADFVTRIEMQKETAFSRLGSSKSLYAATRGEMDEEHVQAALAADARAAHETFEGWANDETSADAAELFADAAGDAADHRADTAPEAVDLPVAPAMYDVLADYEETIPRLGGFVGRTLVTGRLVGQMVGFFVGNADPKAADSFRAVRTSLETQRDAAADLLERVCDTDDDWAAAEAAAVGVVDVSYEEYVDTLEGLGVKPKNIC